MTIPNTHSLKRNLNILTNIRILILTTFYKVARGLLIAKKGSLVDHDVPHVPYGHSDTEWDGD